LAKARAEGRVVGKLVYSSKKEADVARSVAVPKGKGKAPIKPTKSKAPVKPKGKVFEKVLSPISGNGFVAVELDLDEFTRVGLSDKQVQDGELKQVSLTVKPSLFSNEGIINVYAAVYPVERSGRAAPSLTVATVAAIKPSVRKAVKSSGATFTVPIPKKVEVFSWTGNSSYDAGDRYVVYVKAECLGRDPTEQQKLESKGFMAVEAKITLQAKEHKVMNYLTGLSVEEEDEEPAASTSTPVKKATSSSKWGASI